MLLSLSSRNLDNGDNPWEEWIVEICGIDYEDYKSHHEILTMKILEDNLDKIVNRIEKLRKTVDNRPYRGKGLFGELVYDEYIHSLDQANVAFHILALLILETGSFLPEKVKQEVMRTTTWDYDKRWGWSPNVIPMRKLFLEKFREALENHIAGKKIDLEIKYG